MPLNQDIRSWLSNRFGARVKFDEPMSRHTSLRVGGPAEAFVTPADKAELVELVRWLGQTQLPCLVIGDGTNLLVGDGGIAGVVVVLTQALKAIGTSEDDMPGVLVTAMAGVRMATLCSYAIRNGLTGLQYAMGLPGTVGGAITMNAGTALGSTGDILDSIGILLSSGIERRVERSQLSFNYRAIEWGPELSDPVAGFPIFLAGCFRLNRENPERIKSQAEDILRARRNWQPTRLPNAGCFFKNPAEGPSAGELIDRAGLKGRRVGAAEVSAAHANFIVNTGKASAADIVALMQHIQDRVAAQFDIMLEPEVKIVGSQTVS
jgi:UDP-N-acetylmuramate dehydrogenase